MSPQLVGSVDSLTQSLGAATVGSMRWFTRAWQRGDKSDDYDANAAYATQLSDLREKMPRGGYEFAASSQRHLAVDDAKLDRLEVEGATGRILLRLLNGDRHTGYGHLTLVFEHARLVGTPLEALREILEDPRTDCSSWMLRCSLETALT
jgi:hypothetical protein